MANFVLVRNMVFFLADIRRLKNRRFTQIFFCGLDTLCSALCALGSVLNSIAYPKSPIIHTFKPLHRYAFKPLRRSNM